MFFDLNGGILLKSDSLLEGDLINSFVKIKRSEDAKKVIDCRLIQDDMVEVRVDESVYRFSRINWVSQIFHLLPDIYGSVLDNHLLLHGSSFLLGEKIILLLGYSRSGKSTAIYNVVLKEKGIFISDDIIAIEPNELYMLPLSDKPIQVREDVVASSNKIQLINDAWNMNQIAYFQPTDNLKVKEKLYLNEYEFVFCFIRYDTAYECKKDQLNRFDFLNRIFRCCFNLKTGYKQLLSLTNITGVTALDIHYNGDIDKLVEALQ